MVQEREDSGLSVKAFCKQAGIATKTYYYRLRRLREAAIKTGYVTEPAPQNIVIKTADTTVEIPMNTNPEVVAAAVSFLKQP